MHPRTSASRLHRVHPDSAAHRHGGCVLCCLLLCCACVAVEQLAYHNYLHAADVLLSANRLFLQMQSLSETSIPCLDFFALQIACLGV